jgi:hypothetical protein
MLRTVLAFGLVLTAVASAQPSDSTAAKPDSSWRDLAPRLYVQDETWADIDFIKTEVTFVNYVRDRTEADVQLTITCQTTGDGGKEYCLTFLGLGSFCDIKSVLKHTTAPDATPDEVRKALADAIRRGLVPYVARTGLRDALSIEFTPPAAQAAVTDPWHNWVFSLSLDGWANGDQGFSYIYYDVYPKVSRVTETGKLVLQSGVYTSRRRFVLDTAVVTAVSRSYYADAAYGHKLSNHVSLGGHFSYNTDDYSNLRCGLCLGPKLEYDIVPYSEYVRHKVYIQFIPNVQYGSYFDTTLYDKLSEYAVQNEVVLGATLTRSWGTVDLSADGSHYLHDISKNRLSLYGSVSLRVIAGLSVSLSGGYNFIHDQLGLRKAGATEEERLLRLREMATGYSYWTSVGVTYTFGSAFSNIVNPIF